MTKRPSILAAFLIALLFGAIVHVTAHKNMVGAFSGNEWGRYLFGIGAALTNLRWGIHGYVIDKVSEDALLRAASAGTPETSPPWEPNTRTI